MASGMKKDQVSVRLGPDVMAARRAARDMAEDLGFDGKGAPEIETAVSELATNLVTHKTVEGEVILSVIEDETGMGIEVRVEDKGPGIKDLVMAMRDGESTTGSLGIGLTSVRRLMDEFFIESLPGKGTTVVARKWLPSKYVLDMNFSVYSRPKHGEDVCGDGYYIKRLRHSVLFSVVDGLGHGEDAHKASQAAIEIIDHNRAEPLNTIVDRVHKGIRHTRGAAMGLCRIDFQAGKMEHLSIGNVEMRVYRSPRPIRPFCYNGTVGMMMESHRVFEYPYTEGSVMVMFSDGISGKFELDERLLALSPKEIGEYIFHGYARQTDDSTVLVGI
ncbi:MAG: SpoIIE family protein phosphatase [Nitrospirales bacterium]|nr:SpoIIE family protein phosphatase [Nitrospirales bacterium]